MNFLTPPSKQGIRRALERLALLKYFPTSNPIVFEEVSGILLERCKSDRQLEDTVAGILRSLSEWPGPAAFREALSAAWREAFGPKASSDGVNPAMEFLNAEDTSEGADRLRAVENERAILRGENPPFQLPSKPGPSIPDKIAA